MRFGTDFITAMTGMAECIVGGEALRGIVIRKCGGSDHACLVKELAGNMSSLGSDAV